MMMENQKLPEIISEDLEQKKKVIEQQEVIVETESDVVINRLPEIHEDIDRKTQIVADTKAGIAALQKELGVPVSDEIPPSIKIEQDLITNLNQEKATLENNKQETEINTLYTAEFQKTLEIAEYPKVFTEMYQSGVRVLEDQSSTDEEKLFAQKYLQKLTEAPESENKNQYDTFYQELETDMLRQQVFQFNEGSLLHEQRELLRVDELTEKKFDIKVLAPEDWDTMNFMEKETWWKETTGSPSLFVSRGFMDGEKIVPTIFLSKDDMQTLVDKEDKMGNKKELEKIFQHEYRHTQRKFGIENDNLFRFVDEPCTNVGFYKKQALLLDFMGMTTTSFTFKDIKNAYESGNDQEIKNVFNKISSAFGDKGTLLIGSEKSSEHTGDHDGIDGFPLVQIEAVEGEDVEDARFLETILSLRSEIDPRWLENFKKNIGPDGNNISRVVLEAGTSYLLRSYFKHAGGKDTPHINQFLEAMNSEIKRRAELGEQGF